MQNQTLSQNDDQLTAYRSVFVAYILGALRESLARVRAAENLVPDAQRVQAWHVLSYALRVDDAWPDARELLLALAPKMEQAGFRGEWIAYLERGVARSRALGDRRGEAEFSLHVGHLHRLVSAFPQAEAWLARSLRHFEHVRDDRGSARALNQLAYVAYLQHHYADATARVKRAMALLPPDDAERAMSCFVLGMVAIDQKRWQEAEVHHKESLTIRQQQGDLRQIGWGLQNLGHALNGAEKYGEAIACFNQAIKYLESTDLYNAAIVHLNLGYTYYFQEKSNSALTEYSKAEAAFRTLYDTLYLAKVHTNQGLVYLQLKDMDQAKDAFEKSIELFQQLGYDSYCLNSMDGLAMVFLHQNLYKEAAEVLERAIAGLPAISNSPDYAYLEKSLYKHLERARQGGSSVSYHHPVSGDS